MSKIKASEKKRKLLLIGYRGYGDWLYAVPILKYLFQEYEVHLETSRQGWELFSDDQRFASKSFFDVHDLYNAIFYGEPLDEMKIVNERWAMLKDSLKPDKTVNLFRTLESVCVAEKWQNEFYLATKERQKIFGNKDWYKPVFDICDIPIPEQIDTTGLYFSDEQLNWADNWKRSHENDFIILVAMSGSGFHKKYPFMEELIRELLVKYTDAKVYLIGDSNEDVCVQDKRVFNVLGNAPYKQVILMTKNADIVIGPETGLHVAAGMWGTPKIQFCNMSNVWQLTHRHRNDYSIQSQCDCSPCHKMVNNVWDCENLSIVNYELIPSCIALYNKKTIMENIELIYDRKMILC